ncbi:MAG TPA: hypothetical protein VHZ76_07565, partial [Gammaproteobacteria bacterium]|nr:hypothetical protein [Gammaproteobacteria bacterium]
FHSTLSKSNLNPTKNNPPTAISAGLMITNYINKKENKLEELNIIINNSGHFVGNLPSLHLLINQLKFSGVCPKYILMNIRGWPPRAHYLSQEDQCYFDQMQRIYLQGFLVDTDRLLNKFDNIENIESWGLEQLIETKLRDDFQKAIDKTNIEPHFLEEKIKLFRQDRKSLPTTEEDIHNFTFRLKLLLFVIQVKKGDIKLIGQLKEYTELTHQGILPFCTDEEFLRLKINAINELAKQDSYLLGFNKQQTQQFGYQPEGLQLTW